MEVASYFELDPEAARTIAGETSRAVATWRTEAKGLGLSPSETGRMASAFEDDDLQTATVRRARAKGTS